MTTPTPHQETYILPILVWRIKRPPPLHQMPSQGTLLRFLSRTTIQTPNIPQGINNNLMDAQDWINVFGHDTISKITKRIVATSKMSKVRNGIQYGLPTTMDLMERSRLPSLPTSFGTKTQ